MCDDKPGIVSQVANTVAEHQGNWLDSHMVQLAGKFTGLLRIDVPEDNISILSEALKTLETQGISTLIEQESSLEQPNNQCVQFELSGPDRKGIVSDISTALNQVGISIDKMQTHCSSMPWSGDPLFQAKGSLIVPSELSLENLHETFQPIEDRLGIDINFSESSV